MKLYTSFYDLQAQAKTWMQSLCNDLNSIEPLEVVNFYTAASRLISNRLAELSKFRYKRILKNLKLWHSHHILQMD